MSTLPLIGEAERRRRLVRRHHLTASGPDATSVARDLVALHSSDPLSPHLSLRGRIDGFERDHLAAALVEDRSLWRLHAMRRTLFVVTIEDATTMRSAVVGDIAAAERRRLEAWVAEATGRRRVRAWLTKVRDATLTALAGQAPARTDSLSERVPELATPLTVGSGRWSRTAPLGSRLLPLLAMEGAIVRAGPAGSWRSSRYSWALAREWFDVREPPSPEEGRARLVERYVARFGPVTFEDLRWWTGLGVRPLRAAIDASAPERVALDDGQEGLVATGDLEPTPEPATTVVALLPGLDPTPMGWKGRGWYLGGLSDALFDRNGNVGPTVWVDGRIVGGWAQRADGRVAHRLLVDVGAEATARVAEEAALLEGWLGEERITPRFRTPLERELAA